MPEPEQLLQIAERLLREAEISVKIERQELRIAQMRATLADMEVIRLQKLVEQHKRALQPEKSSNGRRRSHVL